MLKIQKKLKVQITVERQQEDYPNRHKWKWNKMDNICVSIKKRKEGEWRKAKKQLLEKPELPAFPLYFPTCSLKAAFSLPNLKFLYSAKAVPPSWSHRSTLMVHFLVLFLVREKTFLRPSQWSSEGISRAQGKDLHFCGVCAPINRSKQIPSSVYATTWRMPLFKTLFKAIKIMLGLHDPTASLALYNNSRHCCRKQGF